jgi:hypothetical protein
MEMKAHQISVDFTVLLEYNSGVLIRNPIIFPPLPESEELNQRVTGQIKSLKGTAEPKYVLFVLQRTDNSIPRY